MVTQDEEIQAKEFLKRAEVKTMRKDLQALREVDSLKERDKIAHIKTLEEQIEEQRKKNEAVIAAKAVEEKAEREEVLTKNEGQERIAEKDLKNYAKEEERQQIFLLESQRLGFEKQIDAIDKEKDPALKLEKNKLLLQKRDQQEKLNTILEQEKKLEDEQKFITEKEQTTTIDAQRKGLQDSRGELEKKLEEVEKKRWEAEKQIQETDTKVGQVDASSEGLVAEKNDLRNKVLGADKSLRDIYSVIMIREEEKRKGQAEEQLARREALSALRAKENEAIQRQQRTGTAKTEPELLIRAPKPIKEKIIQKYQAEGEQRKKFLQDVENWEKNEDKNQPEIIKNAQSTENILPPPPLKRQQ